VNSHQPRSENGDFDGRLLADSVDDARFARRVRWVISIVATLIAASVASAIVSLASAP
jgi:hypothetical protein